jgi:dTDP-glucose 4,6-dehydratase
MRVIVTGGAGFIGSALVRLLVLERGYDVLTIDALTYAGCEASLRAVAGQPNHRFLRADIRDGSAMAQAIATFRPDRIMHLAAESHVDRSITGAADFIQTNVVGTFVLLEAARAIGRIWTRRPRPRSASSTCPPTRFMVRWETGLFAETTPYDPSSPYSASKAASDHLAKAWQRTYGLPVVVSNCSNNYGPYHFPEKLIPLTILNALEGRPLPVYGQGENVRDWLYVEDHARAGQDRGAGARGRNLQRRRSQRTAQHRRGAADLRGARSPGAGAAPREGLITFVADRPGHDARYAIDATRLETELGWRAQKPSTAASKRPCSGIATMPGGGAPARSL